MTEAKPTAQLLLAVETGDPLLAIRRATGLGTGMAYTSDLTERWGGEWLAWSSCGKFWAQALRGVLRKTSIDGMQVAEQFEDEKLIFDVRRTADDGMPLNGVHWNSVAIDEDGNEHAVAMTEIGLGRYVATVPAEGRERLTDHPHSRRRSRQNDRTTLRACLSDRISTRARHAEGHIGYETC